MNRRSFFRFLGAGAATLALSEAIPFGRVWSFPSKIVVPELSNAWLAAETLELFKNKLVVAEMFNKDWEREFGHPIRIGHTVRIRKPLVFRPYAIRHIVEYDEYIVTSVHPPQLVPA